MDKRTKDELDRHITAEPEIFCEPYPLVRKFIDEWISDHDGEWDLGMVMETIEIEYEEMLHEANVAMFALEAEESRAIDNTQDIEAEEGYEWSY